MSSSVQEQVAGTQSAMRNNPRKVSGIERKAIPGKTIIKKEKKVLDTYSSASKKQKDSANDQPFFFW